MEESLEPDVPRGVYDLVGDDPNAPETAELLDAIRAGDADALERLAREQAPRLFRLALRLTGRREDAEDLVQETLLAALPALSGFEGRAKLSTYLMRALGNRFKNRLRARSRSRLVDWFRGRRSGSDAELDGPPDPMDASPTALEGLVTGERAARVREAVTRIEPHRRLTLLLREVEDLSYEEIAEMTGVPVGTVRSRLARARDDLRAILGDEP